MSRSIAIYGKGGEAVVDEALERVRIQAQQQARDYLCPSCMDKRCLNGSICKAFLMVTDEIAWQLAANNAAIN